jgi:Armadillo/beta-catenin-like repeat
MGMMALGREDTEGQLRVAEQGGIQPLVRLLRVHKTSYRVILAVIQTLASLCIGKFKHRYLISTTDFSFDNI